MSHRKELVEANIDQCKKCKNHYTTTEEWGCGKDYYCEDYDMCCLDDYRIDDILINKDGCEWFEKM